MNFEMIKKVMIISQIPIRFTGLDKGVSRIQDHLAQ